MRSDQGKRIFPVYKKQMRGRPKYEPSEADRNTVKSMAACGFSHGAIGKCLGEKGIDPKTLRKHFARELETAADRANAAIANVLYEKAKSGEAWAVCFWLKTRAGWKETNTVEHAGVNGEPFTVRVEYVDSPKGEPK